MPAKRLTKRQQTLKKFFDIGNVTASLIKKQGFENRSDFFSHYDNLHKFMKKTDTDTDTVLRLREKKWKRKTKS